MRDDITTIPISEVFEEKDGCPFCRIYNTLEEHLLEYILGPAMMEPDVRQETNRLGFCARHWGLLRQQKNRLPLALLIETHLQETAAQLKGGALPLPWASGRHSQAAQRHAESCFVCKYIDLSFSRLTDTFFRLWRAERDFRALAVSQPLYCLPHYAMLLARAPEALGKKEAPDFEKAVTPVVSAAMEALRADVTHFTEMFDYRNAGGDWGGSRDAIERALRLLAGDVHV